MQTTCARCFEAARDDLETTINLLGGAAGVGGSYRDAIWSTGPKVPAAPVGSADESPDATTVSQVRRLDRPAKLDIVGNLHLHTTASDGTATHDEVAAAAARAGLDFIIYTDHNTSVDGVAGWYHDPANGRKLLRLMGQEVNDQALEPECNHLLCHFVSSDLTSVASDPQQLIDTVDQHGGLTFLAHPIERPGYGPAKQMLPWISWDISGYTGIELWNAMSDVKWRLRSIPRGLAGAYMPNLVLSGPFPEMLAKWDELLMSGEKVVAVGSSDAHAWSATWKIFTRVILPYEFLFRAVNTHLLLDEALDKDVDRAGQQIYNALKAGHCYVSYDLIAAPHGFSFEATSGSQRAVMGDTLALQSTATLRVTSPHRARLRLIKDGKLLLEKKGKSLEWSTSEPGVYRVEAYRRFWGEKRGWVFTNPIYVRHEP